jgi:hypothetical protein
MTGVWRDQLGQLLEMRGRRILVAKHFTIDKPQQSWVGGGRNSAFSLGLGFLDVLNAIDNKAVSPHRLSGRYQEYGLQIVPHEDVTHLVATIYELQINSRALYSYFVLNQLNCLLSAMHGSRPCFHHFSAVTLLQESAVNEMADTMLDDPNGSEWVSPPICREEVEDLFKPYSRIKVALAALKTEDLFVALSLLPTHYKWCTTAIKAIHYCQTKGRS